MQRATDRRVRGQRGVSLPELLVVVATIGLSVAVAMPYIQSRVREGRVRWAASQFGVVLRASRMVAIGNGQPAVVALRPDPANGYEYPDNLGKRHEVVLPTGVRLRADPPHSITFLPNGSLQEAPAEIRFETALASGTIERWTVQISLAGNPSLVRERVIGEAETGQGNGS